METPTFLKSLLRFLFAIGVLAGTTGWMKLPPGAEVVIKKGENITYDKEKGVFLNQKGEPIVPTAGQFTVSTPQGRGETAPAATPSSSSRSSDSKDKEPGSVSNYSPKGQSKMSSSSASPTDVNMDRMSPITDEEPASVYSAPKIRISGPTAMSAASKKEASTFTSTMASAFAKMEELRKKMAAGQLTQAVYNDVVDREVKPAVVRLRNFAEIRKGAVARNSYYVRILNEQIKICDSFFEAVDMGSRQIASRDPKVLKAQTEKLLQLRRATEYIPIKYQALEAR